MSWGVHASWFAQHKVEGTHITLNRQTGVSFISDIRLPSTSAHEAGHYIGDMSHKGEDIRLLMRGEGAGYKIPFALAQHFRQEFARRPRL